MPVNRCGDFWIGTTAPDTSPAVVGSLWMDTTANLLKRCTSTSPYTFVSVEGGGSGSATPTSAAFNTVSNQVSVLSVRVYSSQLTGAVSVSGLASADNRISNAVSIVSQAVSVVSNAASVADAHASVASLAATSVDGRVTSIHGLSARSVGVSTKGLQSVLNALSNTISVVSNAVSVVSQAVSALSQQNSVDHAALSVRIDTQSQSISVLSQQASVLSQAVSVISQQVSTLSNQVSVLSVRVYSSQLTGAVSVSGLVSADNRLSNAISVVSQAHSALSQAVSVLSNTNSADHAALSVRIDTQSQGISVLSNRLSAVISGASARSVGNVSTHGFQSILDALSNRISAGGGTASVTSTELSAVSAQAASAINVVSNAVSNEISNRTSADDALSNRISALSVLVFTSVSARSVGGVSAKGLQSALNALSNRISAVPGAASTPAARFLTTSVAMSAFGNVAGLSVSVSAGGLYELDAFLMVNAINTSVPRRFGMTFPATKRTRGYILHQLSTSPSGAGAISAVNPVNAAWNGDSASGSVLVSVVPPAPVSSIAFLSTFARYDGVMYMSTTGVVQIQAGASAGTGIFIKPGSYIKAWKIN